MIAKKPPSIPDLLGAAMRRKGLNQEQTAAQFGIAQSTLSRWLDGKTTPRGYRLKQIAKFCGVELSVIAGSAIGESIAVSDLADLTDRVAAAEQEDADLRSQLAELREEFAALAATVRLHTKLLSA